MIIPSLTWVKVKVKKKGQGQRSKVKLPCDILSVDGYILRRKYYSTVTEGGPPRNMNKSAEQAKKAHFMQNSIVNVKRGESIDLLTPVFTPPIKPTPISFLNFDNMAKLPPHLTFCGCSNNTSLIPFLQKLDDLLANHAIA